MANNDGQLTREEIAEYIYTLIREQPFAFFLLLLTATTLVSLFLFFLVWGIMRAGRFSQPVVVVTVVLGLVALMSLLVYAFQPDSESLGQITAAAVGALGGALGTAFAEDRFMKKDPVGSDGPPDEIDPFIDD